MLHIRILVCYSVREILLAILFLFLYSPACYVGGIRTLVVWRDFASDNFCGNIVLILPTLFSVYFQPSQSFRLMPLVPDHQHKQNIEILLRSVDHLCIH